MYRVVVYIDGFNLYHGIKEAGWNECLWLDLPKLGGALLNSRQSLQGIKYFTALVRYPANKRKRQVTFIEALEATGGVDIIYGRYQKNIVTCRNCGHTWRSDNEKMTDVQLAVELLNDAYQDKFDTALLISADGDLLPPIRMIGSQFPDKRVVTFFPPRRFSHDLQREAYASRNLWRGILASCQLPEKVVSATGFELERPPNWS